MGLEGERRGCLCPFSIHHLFNHLFIPSSTKMKTFTKHQLGNSSSRMYSCWGKIKYFHCLVPITMLKKDGYKFTEVLFKKRYQVYKALIRFKKVIIKKNSYLWQQQNCSAARVQVELSFEKNARDRPLMHITRINPFFVIQSSLYNNDTQN